MTETVLIVAAVGAALVGLAKAVPSIVWAIRCPPDSPNYVHPPVSGWLERLLER